MGDIIVVLAIALCLLAVLGYHIKRRKKGQTGCGCGCSGCGTVCDRTECKKK